MPILCRWTPIQSWYRGGLAGLVAACEMCDAGKHVIVLDREGRPTNGLYAAGECAGFGGGGYHGDNALEGTFLGGCIFSGRNAGRHAAGRGG